MKIGIIGCGVMGSAFAKQLSKAGHTLHLFDRHTQKGEELAEITGGIAVNSATAAIDGADLVILAIKPKDLKKLAEEIVQLDEQIVLSILTGTSIDALRKYLPEAHLVRCMPNLGIVCGEGIIALAEDPNLTTPTKEKVERLLKGLGMVFWTQEGKMEAITALAGSGPAFVIALIESFIESGVLMGLGTKEAEILTLQMIKGAIALTSERSGHPGMIRWEICAPGGTTIAGMRVFEENRVRFGILQTVLTAYQRAKEIL